MDKVTFYAIGQSISLSVEHNCITLIKVFGTKLQIYGEI